MAEYLATDYLKSRSALCGWVHLDYVRFPDVVLPVSLWKNYGIEQTSELPNMIINCEVCRKMFKEDQ